MGLNTWDTANVYSNGVSEEMIGKFIKKENIPRHKLVILTKCFGTVGEEPGVSHMRYGKEMKESKDYVNQGGLSRAAIFNAVDASLHRLGVDYIDLLQIHRYDATVPVEETMKALHDLVQSGKVRYIGEHAVIKMRDFAADDMTQARPRCGPTNLPSFRMLLRSTGGLSLCPCKTTTRFATVRKSVR